MATSFLDKLIRGVCRGMKNKQFKLLEHLVDQYNQDSSIFLYQQLCPVKLDSRMNYLDEEITSIGQTILE